VDVLKIDESDKSSYKREAREKLENAQKEFLNKKQAETDKLMSEVINILIDRKARDLLDKRS
jgi:predicted house-cleaning noncanonical NTP pyrophosphatase (MazG superfamily)